MSSIGTHTSKADDCPIGFDVKKSMHDLKIVPYIVVITKNWMHAQCVELHGKSVNRLWQ